MLLASAKVLYSVAYALRQYKISVEMKNAYNGSLDSSKTNVDNYPVWFFVTQNAQEISSHTAGSTTSHLPSWTTQVSSLCNKVLV